MVADRRSLPRQALLSEASRIGRERRPLVGAASGSGDGGAERDGPTAATARMGALRSRLALRGLGQRGEVLEVAAPGDDRAGAA